MPLSVLFLFYNNGLMVLFKSAHWTTFDNPSRLAGVFLCVQSLHLPFGPTCGRSKIFPIFLYACNLRCSDLSATLGVALLRILARPLVPLLQTLAEWLGFFLFWGS